MKSRCECLQAEGQSALRLLRDVLLRVWITVSPESLILVKFGLKFIAENEALVIRVEAL